MINPCNNPIAELLVTNAISSLSAMNSHQVGKLASALTPLLSTSSRAATQSGSEVNISTAISESINVSSAASIAISVGNSVLSVTSNVGTGLAYKLSSYTSQLSSLESSHDGLAIANYNNAANQLMAVNGVINNNATALSSTISNIASQFNNPSTSTLNSGVIATAGSINIALSGTTSATLDLASVDFGNISSSISTANVQAAVSPSTLARLLSNVLADNPGFTTTTSGVAGFLARPGVTGAVLSTISNFAKMADTCCPTLFNSSLTYTDAGCASTISTLSSSPTSISGAMSAIIEAM